MTTPLTLRDLLDVGAGHGSRVAFVYRTGFRRFIFTYEESARASLAVAAWLTDQGLRPGGTVLLWGPNSPVWVWTYFGIVVAGGVVVPADMRATTGAVRRLGERAHVSLVVQTRLKADLGLSRPVLLLEDLFLAWMAEDRFRGSAGDPLRGSPVEPQQRGRPPGDRAMRSDGGAAGQDPLIQMSPDDVVQLLFTSGTTGDPKGVVLTHRNILSNIAALEQVIRVDPSWSFLSVLPLSHIFEQVIGLLVPWKVGARVTYLRTIKPSAIFEALREERPTHLLLVPRLLSLFRRRILHEASEKHLRAVVEALLAVAPAFPRGVRRLLFHSIHRRFGGRLDFFVVGGAPLPTDLEDFWGNLGVPLVQGYGLTETSPILTANFPEEQRTGSVGKPLPGQELSLAAGGEILARGPHVFRGYFEDPEKTAAAVTRLRPEAPGVSPGKKGEAGAPRSPEGEVGLASDGFRPPPAGGAPAGATGVRPWGSTSDGWFKTGDLGELRDGWLYLKGRVKDLIVPAHGVNVYAEDVEAALQRQEGVKDAAVIGLPTAEGEVVHAVLLLEPDAKDPKEIVAGANALLDSTQQIQGFAVWPEEDFPRTPTLKVRKFLVRERVIALQGRRAEVPARRAPSGVSPRLRELVAVATGRSVSEVLPHMRLASDLGLDSLGRLELVSLLETELTVDVEEGDITAETTVAGLERLVAQARVVRPPFLWRWPFSPLLTPLRAFLQRLVLLPLLSLLARVEVEGRENLAGVRGPHLFVSNHTSHLDTPVILRALPPACRRRAAVFTRAETLEEARGRKRLFLNVGFPVANLFATLIPLPQTRGFRHALAVAGGHVDEGGSLVVFPEGTRGRGGPLQPFATGVAYAAQELQVPLIPLRVRGTFEIMPPGKFFRFRLPRRRVRVRIGQPFTPPSGALPEATAVIQRAVEALA